MYQNIFIVSSLFVTLNLHRVQHKEEKEQISFVSDNTTTSKSTRVFPFSGVFSDDNDSFLTMLICFHKKDAGFPINSYLDCFWIT